MLTDSDSTISTRCDDQRQSNPSPAPLSSHEDRFSYLATETIAEIFGYACPVLYLPAKNRQKYLKPGNISNPGILSIVCKRWHAITLSNHSLWSTITIETRQIHGKDWMKWGFLEFRRCLERSGTYPLNIRISGYNEAVIPGILDDIFLSSERWRRIAFGFDFEKKFVQKFNKLDGRLPLLEHLEIDLCDDMHFSEGRPCTAFLSASKLTSITVTPSWESSILPKMQIPWAQISCVTFTNNQYGGEEDIYKLLQFASASLSLTVSQECEQEEWPDQCQKTYTLSRLRQLRFLHGCFRTLDIMNCPALEELEITRASEETITKFLDRSSCALTHIKLSYLDGEKNWNTFHTILEHRSLSTIKSISLADVTMEIIIYILDFRYYQLLPLLEILHLCLQFTAMIRGRQRIFNQISAVRKVVDSRTQPTASDLSSREEVQPTPRSFLKQLSVKFDLAPDMPRVGDQAIEESMQALQFFCISRDVLVSLEISYW